MKSRIILLLSPTAQCQAGHDRTPQCMGHAEHNSIHRQGTKVCICVCVCVRVSVFVCLPLLIHTPRTTTSHFDYSTQVTPLEITYRTGNDVDLDTFIQLYNDSTLGLNAVFARLVVFALLI